MLVRLYLLADCVRLILLGRICRAGSVGLLLAGLVLGRICRAGSVGLLLAGLMLGRICRAGSVGLLLAGLMESEFWNRLCFT